MLKLAVLSLLAVVPIVVSPETTVISRPLASDGLPDYAAVVLQRSNKGVAPELNGAIPFWKAVGLKRLSSFERAQLVQELGCKVPKTNSSLKPLPKLPQLEGLLLRRESSVMRALLSRPWAQSTREAFTPWVQQNRQALDWLIEAGNQPVFYSPLPGLLERPPEPLLNATLFDVMAMQEHGVKLLVDAMHASSLGDENRVRSALEGMHGLSHHFFQSFSDFGLLAGFHHSRLANQIAIVDLQKQEDRDALLQLIKVTQNRLARDVPWENYGFNQSLVLVDTLVRELSDRQSAKSPLRHDDDESTPELREHVAQGSLDPNEFLRVIVDHLEQLGEIACITDGLERRQRHQDFLADIEKIDPKGIRRRALLAEASLPQANGISVGALYTQLLLPDTRSILRDSDSAVAIERLAVVAAALRISYLDHSRYPESLADLSSDPLREIPLDPFTNKPFRYERRGEGFLLYSLGENGRDDGGSDRSGDFVQGEHTPVDWFGEREPSEGPDDIVVRLPIPALELPRAAP